MSPARNPDSSPAPSAMATLNKMVKNGLFFMKSTPFDSLEYVIPASLYVEAGIFAELDKKIYKKLFKTTKSLGILQKNVHFRSYFESLF